MPNFSSNALAGPMCWLLLTALSCFSSPISAQESESEDRQSLPPTRPKLSQEQRSSLTDHIWWNDAAVAEDLGLSQAQRQSMDDALRSYFDSDEEHRQGVREAQRGFAVALAGENLANAEELVAQMGQAAAANALAQPRLKLQVLKLLSASQRSKVKGAYPHLLRQQWVRLSTRASRQQNAARNQRKNRAAQSPEQSGREGEKPPGSP